MQGITLKSDRLKRQQKIHGISTILVPFFGSVAAVVLAQKYGIHAVDIWLLVSLYFLTAMGITIGFHRHFAHRAFSANRWLQVVFAILGSMAAEGPLNYWVATHRRHHSYSDLPGDPHSPFVKEEEKLGFLRGLWHSHMGWTFNHELTNTFVFAKDMVRQPLMNRMSKLYNVWILLGMAIPAAIGGFVYGTWLGAVMGFLWGGCLRTFLQHHLGFWTVGSLAHLLGDRPFDTGDYSRNNLWVAFFTGGEWHNNHHAFPHAAIHGFRWWQIDIGGWLIRLFEKLGWVWDIKMPSPEVIATKRLSSSGSSVT